MASITIRNLDDKLKQDVRVRAARHSRSMEDEVRDILRRALAEGSPEPQDLGSAIHWRFASLGGVELPVTPREPVPEPPSFKR